jgi:hypothetical protein
MAYKGKIYRLICDDGFYYYGSTKCELRKKKADHKSDSVRDCNRKLYQHINSIGWDKVKIELIEDYDCDNRKELLVRENEYISNHINNPFCLNTSFPFKTKEQRKQKQKEYDTGDKKKAYREMNRELIKQKNKEYYYKNREVLLAKKKADNASKK